MALDGHPTRTLVTEQRYRRRGGALIRQCRRELGIPAHEDLDPRQLVGWMAGRRTQWAARTWRQYKAWMTYHLEHPAQVDGVHAEALERLQRLGSEGCPRRSRRTSGLKPKQFSSQDRDRLRRWLEAHPSKWSDDLQRWLMVGALTGLRPEEWREAWIIDEQGEAVLRVRNAKHTNERAHGTWRHLRLGSLTTSEREQITLMIQRARLWSNAGEYERFYRGCAQLLAQTCRALWPRRVRQPTLYSLRHQFAADAKASGITSEAIGAMMGHAAADTNIRHYGRRVAGRDLVRVQAYAAEIKLVREPGGTAVHHEGPGRRAQPTPTPMPRPRAG